MSTRPRIGIIGGGVVGSALGRALAVAGYPVTAVASRRAASALAAAAFIGAAEGGAPAVTDPAGVAAASDLVLCAVPDRAIAGVAAALAATGALRPGQLVVHCAGALPATELAPCARAGARIGGLHPLQAFAGADQAVELLPGSVFGIEGDDQVRAELTTLVQDLGGRPLPIQPGGKARYHAAAAIISNYTTVLARAAAGLLASIGSEPDAALQALLPLLRGTVDNLSTVGLPGALTGPIARGDEATVAMHLHDLRAGAPELVDAYTALGRLAVDLALEKRSIDAGVAVRLRTLLARTGA